jgi:hypothetical protein
VSFSKTFQVHERATLRLFPKMIKQHFGLYPKSISRIVPVLADQATFWARIPKSISILQGESDSPQPDNFSTSLSRSEVSYLVYDLVMAEGLKNFPRFGPARLRAS